MNQKVKEHSKAAAQYLKDEQRALWHDETLWFVRAKRDKAAHRLAEWEKLRECASLIKAHTLSRLDDYLRRFEEKAQENGIHVHWAVDGAEHNRIVLALLKKHGAKNVVKSKSMLTEECGLNQYLKDNGMEVVDTDLGEYIVQLREEPPSHIVLPAIHLKKEDVSATFHQHLHTEKDNHDATYLTRSARRVLRDKFLHADAALTGVNFAIAETGGLVVCTNEGNADMGVHANKLHIACMGIEKIIPRAEHLGIFLRLLARSATGQPITTYTSHFHRPAPGGEMHVVLVDNGRSRLLAREEFRNSLKCIRCGACFNTCPVYRRSGGHSYHNSVAGPIGSILAPNLDMRANADLPFASTLCGSCTHVCPVKINIHEQLWTWRQVLMNEGYGPVSKKWAMKLMAAVLSRPALFALGGRAGRWLMRQFPALVNHRRNPWYRHREMPQPPRESFREWYKNNSHHE